MYSIENKLLPIINNFYGRGISDKKKKEICSFIESYSKAIVKVVQEWSDTTRIEEETDEMMDKAKESDGYFITMTRKNGDKFTDFQAFVDFPLDELLTSLSRHSNLIPEATTSGNLKMTGIR